MKSFIKIAQYGLLLLISLLASGCCRTLESDPAPPNSVRGWHEFDAQGIHGVGEFVLKKGQSIENGKIGVELIKTIAPVKCYERFAEQDLFPKAVVRFYAIPGNETLLEVEVRKSTSNSLQPPVADHGINAIFARDINTKDGWLWFELWR